MRAHSLAALSSLPLLLLTACGPKSSASVGQPATLVPSSSVYLRNTFDTDPSSYLGRFVSAGTADLDESNSMTLACSSLITWRFVDGGGVSYTENLNVSTDVAARMGIPVVAQAQGNHQSSRTVSAQYVLTGKMVAEIPDPQAFATCCKSQPDQCSDRYVSEFIQGTGGLFHQTSRATQADGSGVVPQAAADGEADFSRSANWERAAEFPNPVYFAFKVSPTPYVQGAVDACPAWVEAPPVAEGGIYVVGATDGARSEEAARNAALQSAQGGARTSTGIGSADLGGATLALRVDEWCVRPQETNKGTRYNARVLAFVPHEAVAAARSQAETVAATRAAQEQARLAAMAEASRAAAAQAEADRAAAERDAALNPPVTTPTPTPDPGPGPGPGINPDRPNLPGRPGLPAAVASAGAAERIRTAVKSESFSSDQLSALRMTARGASLTAAEARSIIDLFSFSSDKLAALEILKPLISDPQEWQTIVDAFTFSSDREAARAMMP